MVNIQKAQEILSRTDNGKALRFRDLCVVKSYMQDGLHRVGEHIFDVLYDEVVSGRYDINSDFPSGISRDGQGYMYWRGIHVEHYSHQDRGEMIADAKKLAQRCISLEFRGIPVNSRTAICRICEDAPAGTPWSLAMRKFYVILHKEGHDSIAIFYTGRQGASVVLKRNGRNVLVEHYDDVLEPYYAYQSLGYASMPMPNYAGFLESILKTKLHPSDVETYLVQ